MAKYITEYDGIPFMDKTGREKIKELKLQYENIVNGLENESLELSGYGKKSHS